VTPHDNAKKKGNTDEVLIRQGVNNTSVTLGHLPSNGNDTRRKIEPQQWIGVKAKDLETNILTHSMLIKDDNIDTHVDPEPQIALF
jgi:hypothetical protein